MHTVSRPRFSPLLIVLLVVVLLLTLASIVLAREMANANQSVSAEFLEPVAALAPSSIGVTPAAIEETLASGASQATPLTIANTGAATLTWRISATAGLNRYALLTSDDPGGPAFNWIDISATGAPVTGLSDDSISGPWPIGFDFPYFGQVYSEFYVGSNGLIGFGPPDEYDNYNWDGMSIPDSQPPNNMVAWFWQDLHPGAGRVYYQIIGNQLVVQFSDYAYYEPRSETFTAEVVFKADGSIVIQYLQFSAEAPLADAVIGIENQDGAEGVQAAYYEPFVAPELAVLFAPAGWLGFEPVAGETAPAASSPVTVTLDAAALVSGDYEADLLVLSSDPATPTVTTPVTLHVTGQPAAAAAPAVLDFGPLYVGYTRTLTLLVSNSGTAELAVSDITASDGALSAAPASFNLPALGVGVQPVAITYAPATAQTLSATLTLASNDPLSPTITVDVIGAAVLPPTVDVTPPAIEETLAAGLTRTVMMTVANLGDSDLSFEIVVGEVGEPLTALDAAAPAQRTGINNDRKPVASTMAGVYPAAVGDFVSLAPSPVYLTSVAADPNTGYVYAQENGSLRFYRYDPFSDAWIALSDCPLDSGNNGGATYLDGKIYTAYTNNSSQIGVYDIAGDAWTTTANGLGAGTGNIAADGQYLYLVYGTQLVRYDPAGDAWAALATPSIWFEEWGGLAHFNGTLYGHEGNGGSGFARYDIAGDAWTTLPSVPGGAVLGGAIDPAGQVYYTYGDYGGANWYAFDLLSESWSVAAIPFFFVEDGGLAHVGQLGVSGVYFVEGESGTGFARFETLPYSAWLAVSPETGMVAPGGAQAITVTLDARTLVSDTYRADLLVLSNDPLTPQATVPVTLHVTGQPAVVAPDLLDFGEAYVGIANILPMLVENAGTADLVVSNIAASDPALAVTPTSFVAPAGLGGGQMVTVTYTPAAPAVLTATLTITSNDPLTPVLTVDVVARAVMPPTIELDPAFVEETVATDTSRAVTLTISNSGSRELTWQIAATISETLAASIDVRGEVAAGPSVGIVGANASSFYSQLSSDPYLGEHYTFTSLGNNWTYAAIDPYDIILVDETDYGVTDAEAAALRTFYDSGRPVILGMDDVDSLSATTRSHLYYIFGVTNARDATFSFGSVSDHPIAEGVVSIGSVGSDNDYFDENGAEWVVRGSDGRNYVLAYEGVANSVIMGERLGSWYNASPQLMRNAIDWLNQGWLDVAPTSGVVAAGSSAQVTVTLDASGLISDTYYAELAFNSNDPLRPQVTAPVTMHVTGEPVAVVAPTLLDFGEAFVGYTQTLQLQVANEGRAELRVDVAASDPDLSATPASFVVPPEGGQQAVTIAYAPTVPQTLTATLTLATNDPAAPVVTVHVVGTAVYPPIIDVAPGAIEETMAVEAIRTVPMTVTNLGIGFDLGFQVKIENPDRVPAAPLNAPAAAEVVGVNNQGQTVNSAVLGSYPMAIGDFSSLTPSPVYLTSMTVDPSTGYIYAQQDGGYGFFRYSPFDNTWLGLSSAPLSSGNNGGATYLDGKIYTVYTNNSSQMGVYDVASDTWTTMPNGLGYGTGNITSDGQYLYLAYDYAFKRYDPASDTWTDLASPGFWFDAWGGLEYFEGLIYGHQGDGYVEFGKYDVASNAWTTLPNVPGGAVLGSAIDPTARVYYTYGDYGGVNWYAFDLVAETWSVSTIPIFEYVEDGGMAFVGQRGVSGVYITQGEAGLGFGRFETAPYAPWLAIAPDEGTTAAGSSLPLTATLDTLSVISGTYRADLVFESNDPALPEARVPVTLHVIGAPAVVVTPTLLDFGVGYVSYPRTLQLLVENDGTADLAITAITASDPALSASPSSFVVPPLSGGQVVTVTYVPAAAQTLTATLTIATSDPITPAVTVDVVGAAIEPPIAGIDPAVVEETLAAGVIQDVPLTIANTGGSDLNFAISGAGGGDVDLETLKDNLNANYLDVTDAIPNRYNFSDGETGYYISDGGDDMYDGGNYLATNLGGSLYYSNDVIAESSFLGSGGRYFTRKYPGLFVMIADVAGLDYFEITGNMGADGSGSADGSVLQAEVGGTIYRGFVKRVYNAGDPSVNHLIIVPDNGIVVHDFDTYTDSDYHQVYNLAGVTRIYYLLYAGSGGYYIDNAATQTIMENFLAALDLAPPWLMVSPETGTVAAGASQPVTVTLDATDLISGVYAAELLVESNDPARPEVAVPVTLHVIGQPAAVVTPALLDFGELFLGYTRTLQFEVANEGTADLLVSDIVASDPKLSVAPTAFALPVDESQLVDVTFAPTALHTLSATLDIFTNQPITPVVTVPALGAGVNPPIIGVAPDFIEETMPAGITRTVPMTVTNTGGSNLFFEVKIGSPPETLAALPFDADAAAKAVGVNNQGQTVNSAVSGDYPMAIGDFTERAPSPVVLTSVTVNPATGAIYAQENYGTRFYRYDPFSDTWTALSDCPISSGNNGGATYLNGKIYTVYTNNSSQMGVYDVASDAWTTMANGLGYGTGNITSDGQYLYLAYDYVFKRYDPAGDAWTDLASPGFWFDAWGGLEYFEGLIYGHQGDGYVEFGKYDVAADAWTTLPDVPGGALLGSAIDPTARVYYTYGDYGGTNWYAFDLVAETWGVSTIPLFGELYLDDGGMAFVGQPGVSGVYFTQGEDGVGFGRLETAPFVPWLAADPEEGTVAVGESFPVQAILDATSVVTGTYRSDLVFESNDPLTPWVTVPVTLHVIGEPAAAATPTLLDFGELYVGYTRTLQLRVENVGTADLAVLGIGASDPALSAWPSSFTIPVLTRGQIVTVTYAPTAAQALTATLAITTNSAVTPVVTVDVLGIAIEPPVLVVDPPAIDETLASDEIRNVMLTISNTGGSDLNWEIAATNYAVSGTVATLDPGGQLLEAEYDFLVIDHGRRKDHLAGYSYQTISESGFASLALASMLNYKAIYFEPNWSNYTNLRNNMANLAEYVRRGGVAVINIAGNAGSANDIDPLGTDYNRSFTHNNEIINLPDHDYITGQPYDGYALVTSDFDSWGSTDHGYLQNYPAESELVLLNSHGPSWIRYRLGGGNVVLTTLTYGWGAWRTGPTHNLTAYAIYLAEGWLDVAPDSGVLAAGASAQVTVTLDASGLISSTYLADLSITSNDPARPQATVPVTLQVGGDPLAVVTPDLLNFGETFVGYTYTLTFLVENEGASNLRVFDIVASDPTLAAAPDNFVVPVLSGGRTVEVTYAPTAAQTLTATLTITTNEPVTSAVHQVTVLATAIDPPVIDVAPDFIEETLASGQSQNRILTITNTGGSNLLWQISAVHQAPVAINSGLIDVGVLGSNSSALHSALVNDSALADRYRFTNLGNNWSYATIQPYQLLLIDESDYGISDAEATALRTFYDAGGSIVLGMDDVDNLSTTARNHLYYVFGVSNARDGAFQPGVLSDHPIAQGVTYVGNFSDGDNDYFDENGAQWVVRGSDGHNYVLASSGHGRTVIMGEYFRAWYNASPQLVRNAVDWAGYGWLSAEPVVGVTPAGSTTVVTVTVDATGLVSDTYFADLAVTSNDPATPQVSVPVTLHVTGEPAVAVTPDPLDLGEVFVDYDTTATLWVENVGADTLVVSGIVASHGQVTVSPTSFSVPGFDRQAVQVTYAPLVTETLSAILTLTSNDPLQPVVTAAVAAEAVAPPVVAAQPTFFNVTQDTGLVTTRMLVVENQGRGTLNFDLSVTNGVVSVDPITGTVVGLGQTPITVTFDTRTRPAGFYTGEIQVNSNDPATPLLAVPVNFTVILVPPEEPVNPSPQEGEINVNINKTLTWQVSPHASSYDLYLWQDGQPKPGTPTVSGLGSASYNPPGNLPTGTIYHWQVIARNVAGNTVGAEWSFTTETIPDLTVSTINTPPTAFSGQTAEFSWVVTNLGDRGTTVSVWYDRFYVSASPTFDAQSAIYLGQLANPAYLGTGESYLQTANFTLPQDAVGDYYAYVITDYYGRMRELNEGNNTGRSASSFEITLTPPPDLQVTALSGPPNAFSGDYIGVNWTVENAGSGGTIVSLWSDRVYLSTDDVFDPDDVILGTVGNSRALLPGEGYDVNASVKLPETIFGTYYLFVVTDVFEQVFEYVGDGNNVGGPSGPLAIILSPPPDLEVTDLTTPSSANSGTTINVAWEVTNYGAGEPFETYWYDRVYLSTSPDLVVGQATVAATVGHSSTQFEPGTSYTANANVTLPNGVEGVYYIHVWSDYNNQVFEFMADDNNVTGSGPIIVNLAPSPDLRVPAVSTSASGSIVVGSPIELTWRVRNAGDAAPASSWHDRVYLSTSPTWSGGTDVGTFQRPQGLNAGQTYTQTRTVIVPGWLYPGNYYIYAVADVYNNVYEHNAEGNNVTRSAGAVTVTPSPATQPTDLILGGLSAPITGGSGQTIAVGWTVTNTGSVATQATSWTDAVYLSHDNVLNTSGDRQLGAWRRYGALGAGAAYSGNATVNLPNGIEGQRYVFFVADLYGQVNDNVRSNNVDYVATPLSITLTPPPDLQPTPVDPVEAGVSGQPVAVSWRVDNQGTGSAGGAWYDSVYFSADPVPGYGDTQLASLRYSSGLAVGQAYTRTATVNIPSGAAGNYYLVVQADSRNDLYEHNKEGNNVTAWPITVTVPPPADLVVVSVTVPAEAAPGQPVTVDWHLRNEGDNTASGYLCDAVFISPDNVWGVQNPKVGDYCHTINLAPGETEALSLQVMMPEREELEALFASLTGNMPGVTPGYYYVIVRADILNHIREADDSNNAGASTETMWVDFEELTLGVPAAGALSSGQGRYYRVNVTEGETLRIALDSESAVAFNEVFVRYGEAASRGAFHYGYTDPFAPDQEVLVPTTLSGTYYIYVYGVSVPGGPSPYTIEASYLQFGLRSVNLDIVGNTGTVTLVIEGSKFDETTQFELIDSRGRVRPSTRQYLVDSTKALATFDVYRAKPGFADIRAIKDDGRSVQETVVLEDAVDIQAGLVGQLVLNLEAPRSLRRGQMGTWYVSFANTGYSDLELPLLVFKTPGATYMGLDPTTENLGETIVMLGVPENPHYPVLRPGEQVRIPFYGRLNASTTAVLAATDFQGETLSGVAIDYDDLLRRAPGGPSEAWETHLTGLSEQYGANLGEFYSGVLAQWEDMYDYGYHTVRHINGEWRLEVDDVPLELAEAIPPVPAPPLGKFQEVPLELLEAIITAAPADGVVDTHVIIIADQDYSTLGASDLPGKGKDVKQVKDFFKSTGTPDGNITVLHDQKNDSFTLSPTDVYDAIANSGADADDNLVVYYSGHGGPDNRGNMSWALNGGPIPANDDPGYSSLSAALTAKGAGQNYVISDSCFAGQFIDDLASPNTAGFGATDHDSYSYATPWGTMFTKAFFSNLAKNYTLEEAFQKTNQQIFDKMFWKLFWGADDALIQFPVMHNKGGVDLDHPWGEPTDFWDDIKDWLDDLLPNNLAPQSGGPIQSPTNVVASKDPNDILGPIGYGDAHWIPAASTLGYTIRFENDPEFASAPAQRVSITQTLDSDLDARTFRVDDFGFGGYVFEVPDNRSFYSARLDLVDDLGIYVDVNAGIDIVSGQAFWVLQTIDPETGAPTTDPLAGFLPPNVEDGEGEGFVTYIVKPKRTAETGDVVDAVARIIFDDNEHIDTPPIFNTLDADLPTSDMDPLPSYTEGTDITLTWSGEDVAGGSGFYGVDLYVAVDDGPFQVARSGITETAAIYTAEPGHTYSFYALAQDNAGNWEGAKINAEAATLLYLPGMPTQMAISADPASIPADGGSASTITVLVQDAISDAVASHVVTFTASLGALDAVTTTTNAEGLATVTLQAATTPGVATVLAMADAVTATVDVEMIAVAPADAAIEGPTDGLVETGYVFTATVSPITATLPITYLWQATDQAPITHGGGLTHTATYTWATPGPKTITVTASNVGGMIQASHVITVRLPYQAPGQVTIAGPAVGVEEITYAFTATVSPLTTTTPITYFWQASGQTPVTRTGGLSDVMHFAWLPGAQAITVTASNPAGSVLANHAIDVEVRRLSLALQAPDQVVGVPGSVYATALDQHGNPAPDGQVISFTTTLGTITPASPTTDGTATATVDSLTPGVATINAATEAVSATATLTFTSASHVLDPTAGQMLAGAEYVVLGETHAGFGAERVELSLDGGSSWVTAVGTTTWQYTWTLPAEDGLAHLLLARAVAGDRVETPGAGPSVTVDTVAPTSAIVDPVDSQVIGGRSYVVRGTAADGLGVQSVLVSTDDGASWQPASGAASWVYTWTVPIGAGDLYALRSRALDAAGNEETPAAAVAVTVDNLAAYRADVAIDKRATPAVALPGQPVTYTLVYTNKGLNVAGGVVITDLLPLQLENVQVSSSGAAITPTGAISYTWQVADLAPGAGGVIEVSGVVSPALSSEFSFTNTATIAATYDITPTNDLGWAAVAVNQAPQAAAGGPYDVDEGDSVTLDGSDSFDVGDAIVLYEWDLDDDGSYEATGVTTEFNDTADDSVVVVWLRVTDEDGATGVATTTVTVHNVAPVVEGLASPPLFNEGDPFTLGPVVFSDAGAGDSHRAELDWGDGITESVASVSSPFDVTHVYASGGFYTAAVCVWDDDGGVDCQSVELEVNSLPVAVDDAAATSSGRYVIITVLNNDYDPDGDPLTITAVTQPANGRALLMGMRIRYTPNRRFRGVDTFTYTISDGRGGLATGTVTVNVY